MSAFGECRYTAKFGVAIRDAGVRLTDREISVIDKFIWNLFYYTGGVKLETIYKAIYPFIGGTAVSHSFNLIDPAVGRIQWFGGVTHDANGITGNGGNARGRTGVKLAGVAKADAYVICGVYCRSATSGNYSEIGNGFPPPVPPPPPAPQPPPYVYNAISIWCRYGDGKFYYINGNVSPANSFSTTVNNSQGFWSAGREVSGHWSYRNGVNLGSTLGDGGPPADPPAEFVILDDGTNLYPTNRNLSFAYLTHSVNLPGVIPAAWDMVRMNLAVQDLQELLGRKV